jgi:hypothetical protein
MDFLTESQIVREKKRIEQKYNVIIEHSAWKIKVISINYNCVLLEAYKQRYYVEIIRKEFFKPLTKKELEELKQIHNLVKDLKKDFTDYCQKYYGT